MTPDIIGSPILIIIIHIVVLPEDNATASHNITIIKKMFTIVLQ